MPSLDTQQQVRTMLALLRQEEGKRPDRERIAQAAQLNSWLLSLVERTGASPDFQELARMVASCFDGAQLTSTTSTTTAFDKLVPIGWLRQYLDFTKDQEAPSIFHFFCALTALGTLVCRRVYFDKGYYRVFTNMAVVLVAPSGVCTKSTAMNVAVRMVREIAPTVVLSAKITPEALIAAMAGKDTAIALIPAPELSVFIGKQRYLEGLIQLLTDLLDCPDTWSSETIMRGQNPLRNVGLCILGASTPDWLATAIPRDAFGGGFWSRILTVSRMLRERYNALPERPSEKAYLALMHELRIMSYARGVFKLKPSAKSWYTDWYHEHRSKPIEDEKFSGYYQRKPDHLLRVAMLLHLTRHAFMLLDEKSLENALAVLDHLEESLPATFQKIALSGIGEDHVRILTIVRAKPGIDHSVLMRKMYNMTSKQFRAAVDTMKEQGLIVELTTSIEHTYFPVSDK